MCFNLGANQKQTQITPLGDAVRMSELSQEQKIVCCIHSSVVQVERVQS